MLLSLPKPHSFTVRYSARTNKLAVETLVSEPIKSIAGGPVSEEDLRNAKKYLAIWDTGATNSVISQRVVDECNLKPTGMAKVHSATDQKLCETFFVSIFLPNRVVVPAIRVVKGLLAGCDVLIGMDIIGQGDFAITHFDEKTTFSFRFPSMGQIDFVKEKRAMSPSKKVSRNAPCPCGSGRKYKKCCGR